jgi:hypothetical protein
LLVEQSKLDLKGGSGTQISSMMNWIPPCNHFDNELLPCEATRRDCYVFFSSERSLYLEMRPSKRLMCCLQIKISPLWRCHTTRTTVDNGSCNGDLLIYLYVGNIQVVVARSLIS